MLREIAGEQFFYPEVKDIVSKSLNSEGIGKVILIIGQPGSGKSVFLSQLYDEFNDRVEYLTAIRTEFLKEEDSPEKVYKLFEGVKDENKPKILLLDSLDVLAYSRRRELQEWLFYVDKLKDFKGMTVICASRSFEAEHLYPMNEQKWSEKIHIRPLPDEFIRKIFKKLNYDYDLTTPRFREFLRIPLHLRITADIIQRGGDPRDICTLQGIYAKLCEALNLSPDEMGLLAKLAELMIENRTIYLSYPLINVPLLNEIKNMERPGITGIIQGDLANQKLSFSHQTLIDYFSAWKVINENKSIVDFVLDHNQSLFIRPVLRHILGFLRSTSKQRLFEELDNLFFKETFDRGIGFISESEPIKMHIKTAILSNIASWDTPKNDEGKFLLRLFRHNKDGRTFVIQFFNSLPNTDWYAVLKDIYIIPLLKTGRSVDIEYELILSFLARIAKDIPSEILNSICPLLLAQEHNQLVGWFFMRVSDELSKIELTNSLKEKYTDFMEQIVKRNFIKWYYEIQIICNRIVKYFPEKGLNLYFECIKNELQNEAISIGSFRGSLTDSFTEVLPAIYERIPYQVLAVATDFFEQIMSDKYPRREEKKLPDWPDELLYSDYMRFGLDDFYYWYKEKILEFCSNLTDEAKQIIKKIEKSKWETQRQLSMLCKTKNALHYKDELLDYIRKILKSNLKDKLMYRQSELFIRAVNKVFEFLSVEEREEIINSILNLEFEDKLQARVWIWEPLNHIPDSFRDEDFKKKLEEIRVKYNFEKEYKYTPPIKVTDSQRAISPVSADELRKMPLVELHSFLIKNRDLKERWDFEKDEFYGGVRELAEEVSKIFVEDLDKYKNIIENLSKESENDVYLSYLFWEFSSKGIDEKNIDWLIEVINSTYKREKLQLEIGRVLCKIANNLSREQFDKLKGVLLALSNAKDPEEDKFFEYRKEGYSNDALGEGMNSTRGVVAELIILLLSKFQDEYLVNILERLSRDKTISVRAVLIRYLPYAIKPLGWDKSFELFSNAFEKGAEEYLEEIPDFLQYVPKDKDKVIQINEILNKMKEKRDGKLGEAYALIMTIYYLRGIYSEEDLIKVLNDIQLAVEGKRKSFNLLAHQVKFEKNVDKCLKIINTLLDQEDVLKGRVSLLFREARPEDLKKFTPIIKKIIKKPQIRGEALYNILEYLEKGILIDVMEVFGLLEDILSEAGDDFYNSREFIPASHSKAPLNIINTILECYPEEENRALKALDKLIKLNWIGVGEYLSGLDRL